MLAIACSFVALILIALTSQQVNHITRINPYYTVLIRLVDPGIARIDNCILCVRLLWLTGSLMLVRLRASGLR